MLFASACFHAMLKDADTIRLITIHMCFIDSQSESVWDSNVWVKTSAFQYLQSPMVPPYPMRFLACSSDDHPPGQHLLHIISDPQPSLLNHIFLLLSKNSSGSLNSPPSVVGLAGVLHEVISARSRPLHRHSLIRSCQRTDWSAWLQRWWQRRHISRWGDRGAGMNHTLVGKGESGKHCVFLGMREAVAHVSVCVHACMCVFFTEAVQCWRRRELSLLLRKHSLLSHYSKSAVIRGLLQDTGILLRYDGWSFHATTYETPRGIPPARWIHISRKVLQILICLQLEIEFLPIGFPLWNIQWDTFRLSRGCPQKTSLDETFN